MSFASIARGSPPGSGTWAVVSDTAPKEAVGLAGRYSTASATSPGIVTPIVFGYIVAATGGNYGSGLSFVARMPSPRCCSCS